MTKKTSGYVFFTYNGSFMDLSIANDFLNLVMGNIIPMDPSTFLGSVWGIIYYNLEG
jgi:hypothetical protein